MLHVARWKYRTQKIAKNSPSGHHHTTLSGCIFTTKARIDNQKKNLLSIIISSRCPHNVVNFGPITTKIGPVVWGAPANFNGFHVLAALLQRRRSPETNQRNVATCKMPGTSNSCVLLRWQHYCTALQQRASAKLCSVVQGMELRTFAEGATYIRLGSHHVGHWPTFLFNVYF